MLKIVKGVQNEIVVTATELTTLTNPNFLFIFHGEQENKDYAIVLNDVSLYPESYNKFVINEPQDIDFKLTGYYTYTIYEQSSPTNLDPDNATGIVEVGRMRVYPETEIEGNYYDGGVGVNKIYDES